MKRLHNDKLFSLMSAINVLLQGKLYFILKENIQHVTLNPSHAT
jgi:hypothetical protein